MCKKRAHREAGEKPAETTEDERLNESNDVEESPALHGNTVAGEEYGDGAVESHGESEDQEAASVPQTDTVVDVGTVVVKLSHAPVTDSGMIVINVNYNFTNINIILILILILIININY